LVFVENPTFSTENFQNTPEIGIITSTPGLHKNMYDFEVVRWHFVAQPKFGILLYCKNYCNRKKIVNNHYVV
jgi:hypothetical protein